MVWKNNIVYWKSTEFSTYNLVYKENNIREYKLFLKNCDFNFQIIIQSSKKDLNNYFLEVKEKSQKEEEIIKSISRQYIKNIERINLENKSSIKNFYFIINEKKEKNNEEIIINKLNERYFKIKEFIFRCGNNVYEIDDKNEIIAILKKAIYLI